jgi:hypothetical protein
MTRVSSFLPRVSDEIMSQSWHGLYVKTCQPSQYVRISWTCLACLVQSAIVSPIAFHIHDTIFQVMTEQLIQTCCLLTETKTYYLWAMTFARSSASPVCIGNITLPMRFLDYFQMFNGRLKNESLSDTFLDLFRSWRSKVSESLRLLSFSGLPFSERDLVEKSQDSNDLHSNSK